MTAPARANVMAVLASTAVSAAASPKATVVDRARGIRVRAAGTPAPTPRTPAAPPSAIAASTPTVITGDGQRPTGWPAGPPPWPNEPAPPDWTPLLATVALYR